MDMRWILALLALVASATLRAQDATAEQPDLIPVFEGSDEDLEPLTPDLEWTISGNLQGDLLASSDLPEAREDSSEVRRARISALLEWRNDWRLKLGVDLVRQETAFGEDVLPVRDLSVEYRGLPVHIELGQFVEPFGLLQSSSRGAAFMERPQASGLAPGYGLGIAANARLGNGGLAFGAFVPTRNDVLFGGREDESQTARITYAPLHGDDALLHVGAAASVREPEDDLLQFVTIPESVLLLDLNASGQRLIVADDYLLFGAELAAQVGPVLLQGELMQAEIPDAISFDDVVNDGVITFLDASYTGWYVEAAWALTGERRDYSVRRGTFGGIEPARMLFAGGFGAIELAARYGSTDLRDETDRGERGRVASVGLNWYPLAYAKLMVEGLDITVDDAAGGREEARAIQARLQLHFTLP
jgi:phosphate-selective porin OprO/OprP